MKKMIAFLLALGLCVSLCACGGGKKQSNSHSQTPPTELVLGQTNMVSDYAEFTLFKVTTGKKIYASVGQKLGLENNNSGETFVDMILDWTNLGTQTVSSEDVAVISAVNASGTKYSRSLYAVETNNSTYMSQYEAIAPLSTVRLHCAVAVPENESELTLQLNVNGHKYALTYSLGQVVRNAEALKPGDTVEMSDFATMVFHGVEYTDDVLPSNTSGSYRHYEIDDPANTYLVVKFDITNYMTNARDCDTFVGVKALYMGKYTYTGFVVVEKEDGKGFDAYDNIMPLSMRHLYYLIKVPKTVMESDLELTISFNGKEYIYTE